MVSFVKFQDNFRDKNKILDDIAIIDKAVFPDELCGHGTNDIDRFNAFKDGLYIIMENYRCVGYLCWFPITEEFYNEIIKGDTFYDDNITPDVICQLNNTGNYIFLLSTAILPEYQHKGLIKNLLELANNDFYKIKMKDMVSYACTEAGEKLLKKIGFKHATTVNNHKLMRRFLTK